MFLRGPDTRVCPICSNTLLVNGFKSHLKSCARKALAQLTTCGHCGRPILKDDLREHAPRCRKRLEEKLRADLQDSVRKEYAAKSAALNQTLLQIEAGEICEVDLTGRFKCGACGQEGLSLVEVGIHQCGTVRFQGAGGACAIAPTSSPLAPSEAAVTVDLAAVQSAVEDLRMEVAAATGCGGAMVEEVLDRVAEVLRNASQREEKKYRKLRCSNAAFAEAIGRWPSGLRLLQAAGFELQDKATKTGDPEPHLVLAERLPERSLQAILAVVRPGGGGELQPLEVLAATLPSSSPPICGTVALVGSQASASSSGGLLEECPFCRCLFRFDRLAKHETRCRASNPKIAKFDFVQNWLRGTPGAAHVAEVKREARWPRPADSQPKRARARGGILEPLAPCTICGRRFPGNVLEEHLRACAPEGAAPQSPVTKRGGLAKPLPELSLKQEPDSTTSRVEPRDQKDLQKSLRPSSAKGRAPAAKSRPQSRESWDNRATPSSASARPKSRGTSSRSVVAAFQQQKLPQQQPPQPQPLESLSPREEAPATPPPPPQVRISQPLSPAKAAAAAAHAAATAKLNDTLTRAEPSYYGSSALNPADPAPPTPPPPLRGAESPDEEAPPSPPPLQISQPISPVEAAAAAAQADTNGSSALNPADAAPPTPPPPLRGAESPDEEAFLLAAALSAPPQPQLMAQPLPECELWPPAPEPPPQEAFMLAAALSAPSQPQLAQPLPECELWPPAPVPPPQASQWKAVDVPQYTPQLQLGGQQIQMQPPPPPPPNHYGPGYEDLEVDVGDFFGDD